jgi:S1-C subfamily serine protease
MKKIAQIFLVLLMISISPVASWAGELEDAQERVRQNPNQTHAHRVLAFRYSQLGQYQEVIASYKEVLRIKPDDDGAHQSIGHAYSMSGQHQEAIASYKEAIRIKPGNVSAHHALAESYKRLGRNDEAIAEYKEILRIKADFSLARNNLNKLEPEQRFLEEERIKLEPVQRLLEEEKIKLEALKKEIEAQEQLITGQIIKEAEQNIKEADRLARERKLLEEEKRRAEENRQQPPEKHFPKSGIGSGFFVSKMGHVITSAHVVHNCDRVTVGDNANKQVPAEVINTDRSNDLALLKLSSLERTSAESKSLIQKLNIVVVPLASKGLLRSDDVKLGEEVLVAGFPFGDFFSNSIKVTTGVVSATRGAGDDSGQFQLDAAVQPGNSGGPIYDSSGNIVGVVVSQLDKLKVAKAIGSLPENVNFGIKASTVRQFLISSGLPSKKAEGIDEKSTEQLAEIAQNQALMVMCLQ